MTKSCTIRFPEDLHNKLRALSDVLPYPFRLSQTAIIVAGVEMKIAEICKQVPDAEQLMAARLEEMRVENQKQMKNTGKS